VNVSAALIVRDESAFIEDCLASLAGQVDEIVVVDTGSVDDTIQKARHFPIRLHKFKWCQDFAAARNYAISQASGDWILYIDADERLEVPDPSIWRESLADKSKAAWRLRFHLRVGWTPAFELRLFRNDPRIRFQGVIHERVHDAVNRVCRSDGLEVGRCDVSIHHIGYEGSQQHKVGRNVPLLRHYLTKDPSRVYCWWHLGQMLLLAGDEDGAAEAWSAGIEMARKQGSAGPTSNGMPFASLILLEHSRGISVDDLVDEAVKLFPNHLLLRWIAAKFAIECGETSAARRDLEELAAIDPDSFTDLEMCYDKRLFSYNSRETLALCHFRAGRFREAAEWYRRAAEAAPDPRASEIRARLAEAKAAAAS
jgi:tetratricopeptide (TPR) repeat protein